MNIPKLIDDLKQGHSSLLEDGDIVECSIKAESRALKYFYLARWRVYENEVFSLVSNYTDIEIVFKGQLLTHEEPSRQKLIRAVIEHGRKHENRIDRLLRKKQELKTLLAQTSRENYTLANIARISELASSLLYMYPLARLHLSDSAVGDALRKIEVCLRNR